MTARDFGCRPSEIAGIEPHLAAAFDLDASCSYALLEFDNKRDFDRLGSFGRIMKLAVTEAIHEALGGDPQDAFSKLFPTTIEPASEDEISEDDLM